MRSGETDRTGIAVPGLGPATPWGNSESGNSGQRRPNRQWRCSWRYLRSCAAALLLLAGQAAAPVLAPLAAIGFVTAEAQARSSGGYSRPGFSGSRTPSFGGLHVTPRTPSTSGGYSRPGSFGFPTTRRPSFGGDSMGDRAFSRERAAEALRDYRARTGAARQPDTAAPPVAGGWWGTGPRGSAAPRGGYRGSPEAGWYSAHGWTVPDYARLGPARFGIWDGLFLWFLLSHLSRPGAADFFYNHQDDPGYQQWLSEADRLARDNPELRQKLAQLDRQVAERQGQPRDPNYLPPGVPPGIATAAPNDPRTPSTAAGRSDGSGVVWVVLIGGAFLAFLAWRRAHPRVAGRPPATSTAGEPMAHPPSRLQSFGAMLRHKLSGEGYTPQHFRVGMTLTCDPTPFILAAGATKMPMPETGGGNLLVNVQAVGRAGDGAAQLVRLYLPDRRSMFQLHLDRSGNPDECRFFALIDEVTPADASEWAAWLDPAEGMIGWPEFQTKDGKLYTRAWAPGSGRIPPRVLAEAIETVEGTHTRSSQAMLYKAPTGLAAPAPQMEYILVSAIDAGRQAWVQIWAGIDINPAAFSLS